MVALIENPTYVSLSKIPNHLIAEMIDGKPYYYKNYKQVLTNKKTLNDIMGASTLQGFIVTYLTRLLMALPEDDFHLFLNETGIHIDNKTNLSGDIRNLIAFPGEGRFIPRQFFAGIAAQGIP